MKTPLDICLKCHEKNDLEWSMLDTDYWHANICVCPKADRKEDYPPVSCVFGLEIIMAKQDNYAPEKSLRTLKSRVHHAQRSRTQDATDVP